MSYEYYSEDAVYDDDASYFEMKKKEIEKPWCKIDDFGNLEFVDWVMVGQLADKFNRTASSDQTQQMIMAKLMFLVRKEFDKAI